MISDKMKGFLEATGRAFVASADADGQPHLAVGQELKVPDEDHVVFEAWFCPKTLENVADNPLVAVVVLESSSGIGYQLAGRVEETAEVGILDGFVPEEKSGMPQVESRLIIRILSLMEFSQGAHNDHAIRLE